MLTRPEKSQIKTYMHNECSLTYQQCRYVAVQFFFFSSPTGLYFSHSLCSFAASTIAARAIYQFMCSAQTNIVSNKIHSTRFSSMNL